MTDTTSLLRLTGILCLGAYLAGAGPGPALALEGAGDRMDAGLRREARAATKPDAVARCFVRSAAVERTRRRIAALGGAVGTVSGDILTVRIPRGALAALAAGPEVLRMEAARPVRRRMDKVLPATSADEAHAGAAPLAAPVTGQGVIVGVIDYGLDLSHAAFQDPDGTAVLGLWDQDAEHGIPPAPYTYGTACDKADIDGGGCSHASEEEHGTHVAGIAAGRPVAGHSYQGMAPGAGLLFVNLGWAPDIDDADEALTTAVCDGAAWIFSRAEALGMPAVINMSIGTHEGPHDGSSLASLCLDNLTGPGRIIVAAAGNEGEGGYHWVADEDVFLHAQGVASDQAQVMGVRPCWEDDPQEIPELYGYLWFDAPTALNVRLGVELDGGDRFYSDWVSWEDWTEAGIQTDAGEVGPIWLEGWAADGDSRAMVFFISDEDLNDVERSALWLLEVTGDGPYDGFIDTTYGSGFVPTGSAAVDNSMSIGYPAVASKVIAVASYVTRNEWTDVDGGPHVQENWYTGAPVPVGSRSGFSSRGPSRNEARTGLKPEIAAPGETVISALNSDTWYDEMADYVVYGALGEADSYATMEGTSMASPVVTGAVALLLQTDPSLDPDGVEALLQGTADVDDFVNDGGSWEWGAGKLNILAALVETNPGPGVDGVDGVDDASWEDLGADVPGDVSAASSKKGSKGCAAGPIPGAGSAAALFLIALAAAILRRVRQS